MKDNIKKMIDWYFKYCPLPKLYRKIKRSK